MVLRIGQNVSQFFSRYMYYADSLLADTRGRKLWSQLTIDAINRGEPQNRPGARTTMDYIYKNYPKGEISVYTCDGLLTYYKYNEAYEPQKWTLIDSSKQILGYSCQLASCTFRGRAFFAWFTFDIPISDGPWKLFGLPGHILEAYDAKQHYHYMIKEILQSSLRPIELYNTARRYEKTDRITFLKEKSRLFFGDRNAMEEIEVATGIRIESNTRAGSLKKQKLYDFIERDYK